MMWNALVVNLAAGARIICYEGSPFYPSLPSFLKFISDQGYVIIAVTNVYSSDFYTTAQLSLELAPVSSPKYRAPGLSLVCLVSFFSLH